MNIPAARQTIAALWALYWDLIIWAAVVIGILSVTFTLAFYVHDTGPVCPHGQTLIPMTIGKITYMECM